MKNKAPTGQSILKMTENLTKRCHMPRQPPLLHARNRALCRLFVLLIFIAGCGCGGGGGGFNASNITVTVAPATAMVAENAQVTLQASVNDFCAGCIPFIDLWSVAENNGTPCEWGGVNDPPAGPCPGGTILEDPPAGNTLKVTYYAPSTPGTFHVTAEFDDLGVVRNGTSVITVSP